MSELNEVWPEFEFLLELGMRHDDSGIDRSGFCNAFIFLAGPCFTIHLNRDRGDRSVVIGVTANDLHRLTNVIEFATDQRLIEPVPLKILAQHTKEKWSVLEDCFKNSEWVSDLRVYSTKKTAAWFAGLTFSEPGT